MSWGGSSTAKSACNDGSICKANCGRVRLEIANRWGVLAVVDAGLSPARDKTLEMFKGKAIIPPLQGTREDVPRLKAF